MTGVTVVVDHPLVLDKLTQMRRKDTPNGPFRHLLREIGKLLLFEATRDLPLTTEAIETPIATTEAPALASGGLCLASILRAGMGFLEGMLELVPEAGVAFVGMYREETTHEPVEYYFKAPTDLAERLVIVVDPMLATGNTAVATLDRLKARGATRLRFCCLLAAPEGVARLHEVHPDVDLYTAAIDERLDENAFIVPGLGDAGDRLFGTP